MEFTQQEMLAALEESGRNKWNVRQMTKLRGEGLLPELTHKKKLGTNEPLNVWNETDIDQIVTVYDLLEEYGGSHEMASLVLWLEGYGFSLALLRKRFLRPIEYYLKRLTKGETDPDEIAFTVSSIAIMIFNKFLFTPGLVAQRKKINTKQLNLMTQIVLDILSNQQPDTRMLRSLFFEENNLANGTTDDEQSFEQLQAAVELARDILALPHLIEAIRNATSEQ